MELNRRHFLGTAVGAAAAAAVPGAAMATAKPVKKWNKTADVVIIGSGGAGLATAVSAAEHGVKNILILEKMAFLGGNTSVATGAFNTWDPKQKEQGIEDSPENHAAQTLKGGDYRANPELVNELTIRTKRSLGLKRKAYGSNRRFFKCTVLCGLVLTRRKQVKGVTTSACFPRLRKSRGRRLKRMRRWSTSSEKNRSRGVCSVWNT